MGHGKTTPERVFNARIEKEIKVKNLINSINAYLKNISTELKKYGHNEKFGAWQ